MPPDYEMLVPPVLIKSVRKDTEVSNSQQWSSKPYSIIFPNFEAIAPFLSGFIIHGMTKIGGANYAGFCFGGHIISHQNPLII